MSSPSKPLFYHVRPPYDEESRTVFGKPVLGSIQTVPGSVIAVEVRNLHGWESLRPAFPKARWKVPSAPFLLWTPEPFDERPRVAFEAAGLGFRGVAASEELTKEVLEEALGRNVDLDAVMDWVAARCTRSQRKHLGDVQVLLSKGMRRGTIQKAADHLFVSLLGQEKRLVRSGWPNPTQILRVGRLLSALPGVQARPRNRWKLTEGERQLAGLEEVARKAGFGGGAHLRRDFRDLTGSPPSDYAETVAWEFVLSAWWGGWMGDRQKG